ncbi:hypothetical protein GCL60_16540 [Silvanigrella paludirubra]|uniref:Uncharacterized protein n=1 Tax=Silvanigrella paludirubra TaxID=2499159 RepID=A0A6N6VP87_9BACT|nr:hypothetical protein [Silvanigrella paludirubra]KAB8035837.1 hypothetical protein GCL60_16540 [Silvanigrella paludirubra]
MNILEMMEDKQINIKILRQNPARFERGREIKGSANQFELIGFASPTKNNSSTQSQGAYSFTSLDIYTNEELLTDDNENTIADRVIINNKKYKILGCNFCHDFYISHGELEK